ncbi:hypothetical protein BC826DRAFT_1045650 [Russula brevipes]|nr:hypothetical protein BC826DRAFT_1045650 [Russula brevipes]
MVSPVSCPLSPHSLKKLHDLVQVSVEGIWDQGLDEGFASGVFHEMLTRHKAALGDLGDLLLLFRRPCLGIGQLTSKGRAQIQGRYEVKAAMEPMRGLPPTVVKQNKAFRDVMNRTIKQAEDHAKAVFKKNSVPRDATVEWVIAIGPYFTIIQFGPFTDTELSTCSPEVTQAAESYKNHNGQTRYDLYLMLKKQLSLSTSTLYQAFVSIAIIQT